MNYQNNLPNKDLNLENTYSKLPKSLFSFQNPSKVDNCKMVFFNR